MSVPDSYVDITGHSPETCAYLLGRTFLHTRRQVRYRTIGFAWMGDVDMWGVLHLAVDEKAHGSTIFVRSIANFKGRHLDGKPRFSEAQIEGR